jgi:hypothetical protein
LPKKQIFSSRILKGIAEHVVRKDISLLTVGRNLPTKINFLPIGKAQITLRQLILQPTPLNIIGAIVIKMATLRTTVSRRDAI